MTGKNMKNDIVNKKDLKQLVIRFYGKLREDKILGHFFNHVTPVNWNEHIKMMYGFWENVLFFTGDYSGDPMRKHVAIHKKHPFSLSDFTHWNKLFIETVDEMYKGENAEIIKQRAQSISTIMQIKLFK